MLTEGGGSMADFSKMSIRLRILSTRYAGNGCNFANEIKRADSPNGARSLPDERKITTKKN